eukprot:TRINITY_DN17770_c0_g1_i1.p1 TRINITY_DN17770_c0_g1~~TRINITY_DN17770_c0_g1_i1.p1  ORF type:complete len:221 (+),score=55.23 TRINITY_DN17770_c0_g1_i1:95-664(+)
MHPLALPALLFGASAIAAALPEYGISVALVTVAVIAVTAPDSIRETALATISDSKTQTACRKTLIETFQAPESQRAALEVLKQALDHPKLLIELLQAVVDDPDLQGVMKEEMHKVFLDTLNDPTLREQLREVVCADLQSGQLHRAAASGVSAGWRASIEELLGLSRSRDQPADAAAASDAASPRVSISE